MSSHDDDLQNLKSHEVLRKKNLFTRWSIKLSARLKSNKEDEALKERQNINQENATSISKARIAFQHRLSFSTLEKFITESLHMVDTSNA